jgi:hypothetical protein
MTGQESKPAPSPQTDAATVEVPPKAEPTPTRRRRWHVLVGVSVLRAVAASVCLLAVVMAAAAWRLSQGPVSLAFLTPYVAEAMRFGNADLTVSLDDTVLTWAGWDRVLDIRAVNLEIADREDVRLAMIPELSFGLSLRDLLIGRVVPTSLDVIGLDLFVSRDQDGDFSISPRRDNDDGDGALSLAGLWATLGRSTVGDDPSRKLRRFGVHDTRLTFLDQPTGSTWDANLKELVFWRDADVIQGLANAVLMPEASAAPLSISGWLNEQNQDAEIVVDLADLVPADIALDGLAVDLANIRLPLSGRLELSFGSGMQFNGGAFQLAAAAGEIEIPGVAIEPLVIRSATGRGKVTATMEGLRLDAMTVDLGETKAELAGSVSWENGEPGVRLAGRFSALPVHDIARYWPADIEPKVRGWIADHIHKGMVDEATFQLAVTPEMVRAGRLPSEAVNLTFNFHGVEADYLPPMEKLTDAAGHGQLTARDFTLTVTDAKVQALRLTEGRLEIADLRADPAEAEIDMVVTGPIADQLALIDMPPLELTAKLDLDASKIGGTAAARVKLLVPLDKNIDKDDIGVAVAANLVDASSPGLVADVALTKADLALRVDGRQLEVTGQARLNGIPARVTWTEIFDTAAAPRRQFTVSTSLNAADRKALGLHFDPWVTGTIGLEMQLALPEEGGAYGSAQVDLVDAVMDAGSAIGWRKEAGVAADLSLNLAVTPNEAIALSDVKFTGAGLQADGEANIDANGELERVALKHVSLGDTDLAMTRVAREEGFFTTVVGRSLDLRDQISGLVESAQGAPEDLEIGRESLNLSVDRVILGEDLELTDVSATMIWADDRIRRMNGEARLPDKSPIAVEIAPIGENRRIDIVARDAGALSRALGLYPNMIGGQVRIRATFLDSEPKERVLGSLSLRDFRLVRASSLSKVLTVGSLSDVSDALNDEGIHFEEAEMPFVIEERILHLNGARARGSAIGLTATGTIDQRKNKIDLEGSIIPAYTLNSVLGYIPIIGQFLAPEGEGIFGFAYKVDGAIDNPEVNVNTFSALAPGVLRRMFFESNSGADSDTSPASEHGGQ